MLDWHDGTCRAHHVDGINLGLYPWPQLCPLGLTTTAETNTRFAQTFTRLHNYWMLYVFANDFGVVILAYLVNIYIFKAILVFRWNIFYVFLAWIYHFVNKIIQTIWLFTRLSIQTIRTLKLVFISALLMTNYGMLWCPCLHCGASLDNFLQAVSTFHPNHPSLSYAGPKLVHTSKNDLKWSKIK